MDSALVVRAQGGDREAFSTIAAASYSRLHRVAQNILSDVDLADDATQEALVSMWRHLPRLREPARFEAWSCRVLVNACYTEARKNRRWLPALDPELDEDAGSVAALSGVVYRDQLERAFRRLPIDQRAVVVLHHYLDQPLETVAEVLDIPVGTVHSRLHRAMGALRAALEADARVPDAASIAERVR
jgi:RNA polymerase sigma-70 factor (ECF subfamily)